jgi:hypothetical protein
LYSLLDILEVTESWDKMDNVACMKKIRNAHKFQGKRLQDDHKGKDIEIYLQKTRQNFVRRKNRIWLYDS